MAVPKQIRAVVAVLVVIAGSIHWWAHRQPSDWITWAESRANSTGRRAWTNETAAFLREHYRPGTGIATSGGDDMLGIYRVAGIPLRETFSVFNGLLWDAAVRRPDLFLHERWAVVREGDELERALGNRYVLERRLVNKDEPVVKIYRRIGAP
jgi:hypothetical protein